MKLANKAIRKPQASLLGSVDAQRFLEQLRASRLMVEMTRTAQNGTVPRIQPCDELSQQRHLLRPRKLADEPQPNAPCLSSEALRPWRSPSSFKHHVDSFGRSVPILNAASRSPTKLVACFRPSASDEAR